jgi:uncharacterized membrane protein YeiH
MQTTVILVLDLLGTAIFALTGAVAGVRRKFDIFGVTVLGCCVGVGGGMIRDCIIGATPVAALRNEWYLIICVAVSLTTYASAKYWLHWRGIIQNADALGLGVFTAIGAIKGDAYGLGVVGIMLCGVLTAIGGGVIRDVLSGTVPAVLRSDFYATASLLGGGLYCVLALFHPPMFLLFVIVAVFVTGLRLLAIRLRIQLPASGYLSARRRWRH